MLWFYSHLHLRLNEVNWGFRDFKRIIKLFKWKYFGSKSCGLSVFGSVVFQKRPVSLDSQERLAMKRQKLTDQRSQRHSVEKGLVHNKEAQSHTAPTLSPSFHSNSEPQRTQNHTDTRCGPPRGFPLMHKPHSPSDRHVSESKEPDSKINVLQLPACDSDCAQRNLANNQHRKKKSKKHKDKERERLKEDKDTDWIKSSPDHKQNPDKVDSKITFVCFSFIFLLDFIWFDVACFVFIWVILLLYYYFSYINIILLFELYYWVILLYYWVILLYYYLILCYYLSYIILLFGLYYYYIIIWVIFILLFELY